MGPRGRGVVAAQSLPYIKEVSQPSVTMGVSYKMTSASLPPSKPQTQIYLMAYPNQKHTRKGILGNTAHTRQVDTLQSHHGPSFLGLEPSHISLNCI